jgi:hypothetical protein
MLHDVYNMFYAWSVEEEITLGSKIGDATKVLDKIWSPWPLLLDSAGSPSETNGMR